MKIGFDYLGGRVWQCVIFPDLCIDGYTDGIDISIGWLFWVLRFKFSKKK